MKCWSYIDTNRVTHSLHAMETACKQQDVLMFAESDHAGLWHFTEKSKAKLCPCFHGKYNAPTTHTTLQYSSSA
jgi:hypothetical protein